MQSSSNTKIIIGENGTGKSALLNDLSKEHLNEGKTVIAIATSIHDKFTARQKKFHFYGGRQGRNVVEKAIKKSLLGNKSLIGNPEDIHITFLDGTSNISGFE